MLSPEQKKALRLAKIIDNGAFPIVDEIAIIESDIEGVKSDLIVTKEELTTKVDEALVIAKETQKMEGQPGHTPTEQELLGLIKPLIPVVKNGEDYVLTEKDKKQIAQSIKVPIVEQIIERTEVIKEQPIVTEITNNVENKDTGEEIINKINSDTTSLIDLEKIDTEPFYRDFKNFKKEVLNIPRGGGAVGSNNNSTQATTPSLQQVTDVGATTTNKITVTKTSLGTTPTDAILAQNTTSATSGNQQVSPAITKTGQGYGSSSSQAVDFRSYVLPVQGTPNPSLIDKNIFRINGGTWTDAYWYDSLAGGQGFALYTPSGQSNGAAGTTRIATFNNTGTNTWLDFNFTGTRKSSLGADNQRQMIVDSSSNNGLVVRINGTSNHYLGNGALLTYGYGGFQTGINAGSTNVNTSTLQSSGGLALKVKKLTVSGSLDNSATHWLLDGTNSFSCTGTPTYSCSHWANESECLANDAHGGPCAWSAGSSCSAFDNEFGMGTCSGTSGCTVSTSACTGGDEATCLANDDSYGGSCAWNPGSDCSAFNGNEAGCSGQTGCSVASSNSCPSQMDEGSCTGAGCSWNGMSCDGDNSTCTGTYGSGCSGSYNTGGCTGTYGSGCSGTSSCSGINDSTSCTAEGGCTSTYVINGNLPDGELYPDRTFWALNDSSTNADAVLLPASGQTINMTTSLTLSTYKDGVHLAYYKDIGDCSIYNSNESLCGSTSGCTQGYIDCAGYTDSTSCTADTHCSWNGASCDGGVYFSNCSGSYVIAKNWYVWSRT